MALETILKSRIVNSILTENCNKKIPPHKAMNYHLEKLNSKKISWETSYYAANFSTQQRNHIEETKKSGKNIAQLRSSQSVA